MEKELKQISDYWQEKYSSQVKEYRPFQVSEYFKRFASLFAPGHSYFYVVNMYNFELEYVSDSVKDFVSKSLREIKLQDLLQTVVSEEIESVKLKSKVISDFYTSFLKKEEVWAYKNMFTYRMLDGEGKKRKMLYQAFPLSVLENGTPEHVFCLQTDVSHLQVTSTNTVSFIHLHGGRSYFNVDISQGNFDPEVLDAEYSDFSTFLTKREKQIVNSFSRGLSADQIANELNLSPHTIKTHRKNILRKTGCTNTTELVAKCLTSGVISPGPKLV
ncbi:LuxR C-terminal-related transcriptional regulator [Salinimicrobium catena]|uniref:response regulator transcription factor n=1 Tax=Salinimicrobium catena TaxID=390640 RepID=UPI002FE43C0B